MHSLALIDGDILIDAPPTIIPQLRRAGLSPSDVSTLLFTHWHGDHFFGFPFLILERKYISDRMGERRLAVHSPIGGAKILADLCETAYPGTLGEVLENGVDYFEDESGSLAGQSEWKFERFKVNHVAETDPHGYQLTHSSGVIIIHCGDSGPCEEISSRAGSADIVIIEVGVPDQVPTEMHFKPSSLRTLAEQNPTTTFLATHLFTDENQKIGGLPDNVFEVSDGDSFSLSKGEILQLSN